MSSLESHAHQWELRLIRGIFQVSPTGPLTDKILHVPVGARPLPGILSQPLYELMDVVSQLVPYPTLGCTCGYCSLDQPSLFPIPVSLSVGGLHGHT